MTKLHMKHIVAICLAAAVTLHPIQASAAVLKKGTVNGEVKKVQLTLRNLGYYNYPKVTGFYGSITANAVKKFQKKNGLDPDGIVGNQTKTALLKYTPKVKSAVYVQKESRNDGMLDWFDEVRYLWKRGMNAVITDVETGKSFQVKRTFGSNHADVEPLTRKDSNIIKDIWNGWGWERRAVVVQVEDNLIAGSMTAMPHAGVDSAQALQVVSNRSGSYGRGNNLDAVKQNGANGVMDIHFLNSRTHGSNRMQKDQQDMVKKAAKYIAENANKK